MSGFCPKLRPDLVVEAAEDGRPLAIADAVFDRRIDLGPATAALVARLDGRPLEAIIAALLREHGPRDRIERLVRRFLLLGLIEGAATDAWARLGALRRGEAALAHAVLEGARFACQGSGACCQGHRLGPLADADLERLAGLDLAGAFPALGGGPYHVEHTRDDGETARYLRQVDDRCAFLQADERCGLHARFGPEAKPGLCRLYPLEQTATLDGIKLWDKGTCQTFAVSARAGLPLASSLPQLLPLLPARHHLYHPVVRFDERTLYDHGFHLQLTRAAIAAVEGETGAGAALRMVGRMLERFGAALADCPLADGEPDATARAALARRPEDPPAPDGLMREGAELLTVVLDDLAGLARGEGARLTFGARLLGTMAVHLAQASRRAQAVSEGAAGPALGADASDALRLSVRQTLFGPRSLVAERPRAALLGIAVKLAVAAAADDLSLGHSLAARLLEVPAAAAVLVQHEELAPTILEGMPLLA